MKQRDVKDVTATAVTAAMMTAVTAAMIAADARSPNYKDKW